MSVTQFGYIQSRSAKDEAPVFQSSPNSGGSVGTVAGTAVTIPVQWGTGIIVQNKFAVGTQQGTVQYQGTENCRAFCTVTGTMSATSNTNGNELVQLRQRGNSGTLKRSFPICAGHNTANDNFPLSITAMFNLAPGDIIDCAYLSQAGGYTVSLFFQPTLSIATIDSN